MTKKPKNINDLSFFIDIMSDKNDKIKLSKWLDQNLPQYFPNRGDLIDIIETIMIFVNIFC